MTIASDVERLVDDSIESVTTSATVQAQVRGMLDNHPPAQALDAIAVAMGEFRSRMEDWIDNDKDKMKRVNNVINDVSRICRDHAGHSIKMKSRKHGYVYAPEKYIAPVKSKPVSPTPVEDVADTPKKLTAAEVKMAAELHMSIYPVESIAFLMEKMGDEGFLDAVKQIKS